MTHKIGLVGIFLAALVLQAGARTDPRPDLPNVDRLVLKVLPVEFVAGYGSFLASLLWVRIGFEYADWALDQRAVEDLQAGVFRVTELDPDWVEPYQIGAMMLSDAVVGDDQAARRLLSAGIDRFPGNWRLRLYLGLSLVEAGAPPESISKVVGPILDFRDTVPDYAREFAVTSMAGGRHDDPLVRARSLARVGLGRPEFAARRVVTQQIAGVLERAGLLRDETSRSRMDSLAWIINAATERGSEIDRLVAAIGNSIKAPESESSKSP